MKKTVKEYQLSNMVVLGEKRKDLLKGTRQMNERLIPNFEYKLFLDWPENDYREWFEYTFESYVDSGYWVIVLKCKRENDEINYESTFPEKLKSMIEEEIHDKYVYEYLGGSESEV